jgi:hypothetical protein
VKLLLDEMHAPHVATRLRARGLDVVAVKERPDLVGLADEDLLVVAAAEGRVLVTENVKDFGALSLRWAVAGRQHAGLIFTHPGRFPRGGRNHVSRLTDALAGFIREQESWLGDGESLVWWLKPSTSERPG